MTAQSTEPSAAPRTPTVVELRVDDLGEPVDARLFSQFFEHMATATVGGISAELLANPTLAADSGLSPAQVELLHRNEATVRAWRRGDDGPMRERWSGAPLQGGFPATLVEEVHVGVPLGWAPLGWEARAVRSCPGRIGDGVRVPGRAGLATAGTDGPAGSLAQLDDVPGLRQGVRLPTHRCRSVEVSLVARPVAGTGVVEVLLRRREPRVGEDGGVAGVAGRVGDVLARSRVAVDDAAWHLTRHTLDLPDGAEVEPTELVDLCVRWLPDAAADGAGAAGAPGAGVAPDLVVDRISAMPADHVEGFDPEIVDLARGARIAELRWPGGNFVSHYHWRDGVGPRELRPTRGNPAWGGLEQNEIGTDEFLRLCELIGVAPHLTVNSGTGSSTEAAEWVEYCNGGVDTPMGALRARNGHPEPYGVLVWEVGNENFGTWQGGYVGSEENARRFAEFAPAMRAASPVPIEVQACGSWFDLVPPSAALDISVADGRWHDELVRQAPDEVDVVSLHALPVNDEHVDGVDEDEVHGALMANVVTTERRFFPELLARLDGSGRRPDLPPIRLSVTEWGPVGARRDRVRCENAGGGLWGLDFLAMLTRFGSRIAMASPNGFLHGGSIKKGAGVVYTDAVFEVTREMASLVGHRPVALEVTGPTYDVEHPPDLGLPETGVPTVGVSAFTDGDVLTLLLVSRRRSGGDDVEIALPDGWRGGQVRARRWTLDRIGTTACPADPTPVVWTDISVPTGPRGLAIETPARSAVWITVAGGVREDE